MKKGVIFGMFLMLIISILPVSVMGQCPNCGPTGEGGSNVGTTQNPTINDFVTDSPDENIGSQNEKYYDTEKNEITSSPTNSKGNPNPPLNIDNLKTALNLKNTWNNIQDSLRTDFLKKNPDKVSELSADQLTLSNNLRDLIKDPNNHQVWEEITNNNQKAIDVLKKMGYENAEGNLQGWKWDELSVGDNKLKILKYGENGPKIIMDLTKGYQVTFNNGNAIVTNPNTGNSMGIIGDMTWTPAYDVLSNFNPTASTTAGYAGEGSPGRGGGGLSGGGGGLSGGGGGSGGSGGGGAEQGFQEAFQVAQQMVQLAQSLLGPLAESMKSNGKGSSKISGPNEFGGVTAEMEEGAGIALNRKGEDTLLALNEEGKSVVKTKKDEEETELENVDFLVPKQLAGEIEQETTLALNGIPGNDPSNSPSSSSSTIPEVESSGTVYGLFFPLLQNSELLPLISAQQVNFGQYIKLFEHNLDVSGRDINVYALKTFNEVEAGGQNIKIFSGDIEIKIEGQRIMYPRLVKNAPYGFARLSNKLDNENKFRLQHYEDKKGIFYDGERITSVGDITTEHPKNKLLISKIRENMWEN